MFRITSIYTKNTISEGLDRNSSRIMSDSNDGQIMKKPKLEITSTEGMDDQRQVSHLTRQKQHSPHIINLED